MPNMSNQKISMKMLETEKKISSFDEVALGYTEAEAHEEAERCLNCPNPRCMTGCPAKVPVPKFISEIKNGDYKRAAEIISERNCFPAFCSRVCPQERQCEGNCVRGIKGEPVSIGALERFASQFLSDKPVDKVCENKKNVAIIGAGPAGLACAEKLSDSGEYNVTVFDSEDFFGGVLIYGIPEFRLPAKVVTGQIERLKSRGVSFKGGCDLNSELNHKKLLQNGYIAVFIAVGAGKPYKMDIVGEDCCGVYLATDFLRKVNCIKTGEACDKPDFNGKIVSIVGGGNVAMDSARCAVRLGAKEVTIVYRRGEEELPACRAEINEAKEEGVQFKFLTNPKEIAADENGNVCAMKCVKMELGEADASGRRRPVEVPQSEFAIKTDIIISAIGTGFDKNLYQFLDGIETNEKGYIKINEKGETSIKGVYAGGDDVTGPATVVSAIVAGRNAAAAIKEYLAD